MHKLITALACLCLLASAQAFELPNDWRNATEIGASEIEADIVGNHLEAGYDAHPYRFFVGAGGELRGQLGFTGSDDGRWWLSGDDFCYEWAHYFDGVPRCYRLSRDGEHVVLRSTDAFTTSSIYGLFKAGRPAGY